MPLAAMLAVVVLAVAAGPAAAAKGGNTASARACQQGGHMTLADPVSGLTFKNAGDCASHGAQGAAYSSLQVLTDIYSCPAGTCWGTISGSGLKPGEDWLVSSLLDGAVLAFGILDATGAVSQKLVLPCGQSLPDVLAFSTTAEGARIRSLQVGSPCG